MQVFLIGADGIESPLVCRCGSLKFRAVGTILYKTDKGSVVANRFECKKCRRFSPYYDYSLTRTRVQEGL